MWEAYKPSIPLQMGRRNPGKGWVPPSGWGQEKERLEGGRDTEDSARREFRPRSTQKKAALGIVPHRPPEGDTGCPEGMGERPEPCVPVC